MVVHNLQQVVGTFRILDHLIVVLGVFVFVVIIPRHLVPLQIQIKVVFLLLWAVVERVEEMFEGAHTVGTRERTTRKLIRVVRSVRVKVRIRYAIHFGRWSFKGIFASLKFC